MRGLGIVEMPSVERIPVDLLIVILDTPPRFPEDARTRLLVDGELAWVYGPRRHELAEVRVDERLTRGDVNLRDIVGVAPSEIVRVVKPDLDDRGGAVRGARYA